MNPKAMLCCFFWLSLRPYRFIKYASSFIFTVSIIGTLYSIVQIERARNTFEETLSISVIISNLFILVLSLLIIILCKKRKWRVLRVFAIFLIILECVCVMQLIGSLTLFFKVLSELKHHIHHTDKDRKLINKGAILGVVMYTLNFFINIWFLNLAIGIFKMSQVLVLNYDFRLLYFKIEHVNAGIKSNDSEDYDVKRKGTCDSDQLTQHDDSRFNNSVEVIELMSRQGKNR